MKGRLFVFGAIAALALAIAASNAWAAYDVYVGYADSLRPSGFFPNPWQGSGGVQFFNGNVGGGWDTGAVMIVNSGATSINITDLKVDNFGSGAVFQIWGTDLGSGESLGPGMAAIFAQHTSEDFDSSDQTNGTPLTPEPLLPRVHVTVDGVTSDFTDSGMVLDTLGFDVAHWGFPGFPGDYNESIQWQLISSNFNRAGSVPEPSALVVWGVFGALGTAVGWWKRRKAA